METETNKTERMHQLNFYLPKEDYVKLNEYCTKNKCCSIASVLRGLISKKLKEEEK